MWMSNLFPFFASATNSGDNVHGLYKKNEVDAETEKACITTYAHASASQICLQNLYGQQQNSPMADLGSNLDPKTGP